MFSLPKTKTNKTENNLLYNYIHESHKNLTDYKNPTQKQTCNTNSKHRDNSTQKLFNGTSWPALCFCFVVFQKCHCATIAASINLNALFSNYGHCKMMLVGDIQHERWTAGEFIWAECWFSRAGVGSDWIVSGERLWQSGAEPGRVCLLTWSQWLADGAQCCWTGHTVL